MIDKDNFKIIAISVHAWGSGKTVKEAVKNCKSNIPWVYVKGNTAPINVFMCLEGTKVSQVDGSLEHPIEFKPIKIDEQVARKTR